MVNIADNTGAKTSPSFQGARRKQERYAQLGEIVVVSIKTAEPRKMVKKKKSITLWWSGRKTLSEERTALTSGLTRTPSCFWTKPNTNRWEEEFSGRSRERFRKKAIIR